MCRTLVCLCAVLALAAPKTFAGEVTIKQATILDASNQYPSDSLRIIDGDDGPTTVNVITGALVGDGIQVFDSSSVLLVGGRLIGNTREGLNAYNTSLVYLLGGEVRSNADDGLAARDASTLFITGGGVRADLGSALLARNDSRVYLSGGLIHGGGLLTDPGFAVGATSTHAARVEVSGGTLLSDATYAAVATGTSQWAISGGTLSAGGESRALLLEDESRALITGGVFQTTGEFAFELRENAQIEFRDGDITGGILASGASQIHVYGFNLSSAFGEVTGTLEGGGLLDAKYQLLDQAQLILHSLGVSGDTDGDQDVDLEDLNNVRNHFGGDGLGDTNGDHHVDLQDLNDVRNHFGFQGGSARAVPEPASLALTLATLFALLLCRRGRAI